jgi:hypothetical protein
MERILHVECVLSRVISLDSPPPSILHTPPTSITPQGVGPVPDVPINLQMTAFSGPEEAE